jgi:undecaprenyl pyrophosphate synthase
VSKLGRRREKEKEAKTKIVGTRLTEEEYRELVERCQKLGITPAQYLRHLLTKKERPKVDVRKVLEFCEGYKELAREINAIGVNLNQLTRYVHKKRELDVRVLEKIAKIEEELRNLLYLAYKALEERVDADTPSAE